MGEVMNDFKIGDVIYCTMFLDQLHRSDGEINICIMRGIVEDSDPFTVFAKNGLGDIISDTNHDNFHTKNEAINAMIKRLEGLRDE